MESKQHKTTVTLTQAQFVALTELCKSEQCDISSLVSRGVDTFLATYQLKKNEERLDRMHEQIIKLLVSLMKLVGQTLYFSSLPITTGPVKARLNKEGISVQWHQSESFARDLLSPPAAAASSKTSSTKL